MAISDYLRELRRLVGSRLLLMPAVAAIIRDELGRVLVLQKAEDGAWSLPAGAIEPGESPEEAVARETAEEVGLMVRAARLVAVLGGRPYRTRYPNGDEVEFTVCVFECDVEDYDLAATDGEAAGFRWVEAPEVAGLLDLPYPEALFVRAEASQ